MLSHTIIFSHGFGVKKDDRGLFTDIATAFPKSKSILFDYNDIDEKNNTLTVRPFSEQAAMLQKIIQEQQTKYPDAIIDLICHSQGCRVASIAKPTGIRKTIFLAPPTDKGTERMLNRYKKIPDTHIDLQGVTKLPRSDGSTTLIPATYFTERQNESNPIKDYNELSKLTELIIIKAKQDTILGNVSFAGLDEHVELIEVEGNHDFSGDARKTLLLVLQPFICT